METSEIIKALANMDNGFPREALEAAVARREEITPLLLEMLERALADPQQALDNNDYAFLYAMFLLAEFRDKRAYPLIVKLVSLPSKTVDALIGDTITMELYQILASVSCGDTGLLKELIENQEADEYVRDAGVRALVALVVAGELSREEVLDYFKDLLRGGLERQPSFAWDGVISAATDLYPDELYEDIKKAYEEEMGDETIMDMDFLDDKMALGKEALLAELPQNYQLLTDAVQAMSEWNWEISEPESAPQQTLAEFIRSMGDGRDTYYDDVEDPQTPYRAEKKVGRNAPCPCGSGKKYKKCCGAVT